MDRRQFLSSAAYVGSALVLGAAIPRGFLGDPAGGFYAPIPTDLTPYLHMSEAYQPSNQMLPIRRHSVYALWAPPGSTFSALAMFAGTTIGDSSQPDLYAAQMRNVHDSIREVLTRHHEPGWFLVRESRVTSDRDVNDDPIIVGTDAWKRVGYVKWMTRADMASIRDQMRHGRVEMVA